MTFQLVSQGIIIYLKHLSFDLDPIGAICRAAMRSIGSIRRNPASLPQLSTYIALVCKFSGSMMIPQHTSLSCLAYEHIAKSQDTQCIRYTDTLRSHAESYASTRQCRSTLRSYCAVAQPLSRSSGKWNCSLPGSRVSIHREAEKKTNSQWFQQSQCKRIPLASFCHHPQNNRGYMRSAG